MLIIYVILIVIFKNPFSCHLQLFCYK